MVKRLLLLLLPLSLILCIHNVHAMEVGAYNIGSHIEVIDNTTDSYTYTISGNPWGSLAGSYGYIIGNVGLYKVSGDPTSVNTYFRQVYVNSYNSSYVCDISSPTYSNSTFNGGTFTYKCPVAMTSYGITSLVFQFSNIQSNIPSTYRLVIGSLMTFEIHNNQNVSIDTSGTTNAINNQINNDNTNTQSIINNQNQNSQSVINNQNQNTQDIINNQNSNSEKEIESQKVCNTIDKQDIVLNNSFISNTGSIVSGNGYGVTDFIYINNSTLKLLTHIPGNQNRYAFYDKSKTLISYFSTSDVPDNTLLSIPSGVYYFRASINISSNKPTYEVCTNGNQAIVDSQQENTQAINDVNDTLKDDTVSNPGDDISNISSQVSSTDSISDIFLLPIRLIQIVLNSLNSTTCNFINLGSLYGHNLTFTCINLRSILGNSLYGLIDLFFAFGVIIGLRKYILEIFSKITSLKEDNLND